MPYEIESNFSGKDWANLRDASARPAGNISEIREEIRDLQNQERTILASVERARAKYEHDAKIKAGIGGDAATEILERANAALESSEADARKDLALILRRVQTLVVALTDAAAAPSLSSVPTDVLTRASALLPLIQPQVERLDAAGLVSRLNAASVRGDDAESLALAMTARPIVNRLTHDDPTSGPAWEADRLVNELTRQYRDDSVDDVLKDANDLAAHLGDAAHRLLQEYTDRSGDPDPFGYLQAVQSA